MIDFALVAVWRYIAAGLAAVIVGLAVWIWAQGVQIGRAVIARDKAQLELS